MTSGSLQRRAADVAAVTGVPIGSPAQLVAAGFLSNYAGRTRSEYAADLRQFFTWCAAAAGADPLTATRTHLQVYARTLEDAGRAKATVARKLSTLSGFYRYAADEDVITRSPMTAVRRPKLDDESPRFGLDRAELRRLLDVAETTGPVAYALVCLLALNGLRVSSACAATAADLDTARGHRLLTVTLKGGKRRAVPLVARTAAALDSLPSLTGAGATAPVVAPVTLLGINRYAGWRLVRRVARDAGITKRISPHSLRHTFVTLALDAGVELRDVQDAAGHADPRTTRRYDRSRHALDRAATYRLVDFLDEDAA